MLARPRSRTYATGLLPLAAVAVAFMAVVLASSPLRMSLGWDEAVYASQISQHHPIMGWGAERARGLPLLVAPVTLLTSSVVALRVYLAILAGVGLFLGFAAWRGLRPPRILALAALLFGGLWTVQFYAPQAFPNLWEALGAVASLGLFLQAIRKPSRLILALLAIAVAFTGLMRPVDAVVLCLPMAVVALVKTWHRTWPALVALGSGLAVALGEWLWETYAYFGGIATRLHQASNPSGGTALNLLNNLRIISGGRDSSLTISGINGTTGWYQPWMLIWWLALIIFAGIGTWLARRSQGWAVAVLPVACAAAVYLLYSFPVRDNARYLLPAWPLMAVPAADGITWLCQVGGTRRRVLSVTAAVAFIGIELAYGHVLLTQQLNGIKAGASANDRAAMLLAKAGVRPPCVVTNLADQGIAVAEPAAYEAGCSYRWNIRYLYQAKNEQIVIIMRGNGLPAKYAIAWRPHRLWGLNGLVSYVQPPPQHSPHRRHHHRKRR